MAEGSKTEKATPKKRRDERKKGNVFLSNDANIVASLLASMLVIYATSDKIVQAMSDAFLLCFQYMREGQIGHLQGYLGTLTIQCLSLVAIAIGPIMVVGILVSISATMAQTRLLVAFDSIKPKFSRMNPLEGVKRLFSLKSIIDTLKSTLKIIILLYIIFNYLKGLIAAFPNYMNTEVSAVCQHIFSEAFSMVLQIVVAFTALAAFDFFYQWWDYERQLKMSKQETKEEYKQMEGDPKIKGKIKEMQRKIAQSRMMQQVPEADVVVRNPTHFAVALRYHPDRDNAPVVLAKGMDELALRIVKVAEENKVTVIENVQLARALYATSELQQEIHPELYGAVAEVLVYLYRVEDE